MRKENQKKLSLLYVILTNVAILIAMVDEDKTWALGSKLFLISLNIPDNCTIIIFNKNVCSIRAKIGTISKWLKLK